MSVGRKFVCRRKIRWDTLVYLGPCRSGGWPMMIMWRQAIGGLWQMTRGLPQKRFIYSVETEFDTVMFRTNGQAEMSEVF